MPSKGYASSARVSNEPGGYAEVLQTDFGVQGGTLGALSAGTSGSLATTTARVAITWITTQGESGISSEQTVGVTGPNGDVIVTKPTTPSGTATVLGWRVYSSSGAAGTELLQLAGSTTQAQQNFSTTQGTLAGYPLTQTTVQINVYGAGSAIPLADLSGIQPALPSVGANTTVDYFFRIPNAGGRWKIQKSVEWMRPQGLAEPGGITVGPMDVLSPLYPGTGQVVTASISAPVYFVMNQVLFVATASGTTAATFLGFSNFNQNYLGVTTDGTVKWVCLGRQILVRAHFGNASASPATPVAQEYDLFEA